MKNNPDKIQIEILKLVSGQAEGKFGIAALIAIVIIVVVAIQVL